MRTDLHMLSYLSWLILLQAEVSGVHVTEDMWDQTVTYRTPKPTLQQPEHHNHSGSFTTAHPTVYDGDACYSEDNETLAKTVLANIFSRYDQKAVPAGRGVDVFVDLMIQAVSSISENSASFTADLLFSQIWEDPGVRYDNLTRCLPNLTLSDIMIKSFWLPNVCFQNSKSSVVHASPTPNIFIVIYPNGTLWVNYRVKVS